MPFRWAPLKACRRARSKWYVCNKSYNGEWLFALSPVENLPRILAHLQGSPDSSGRLKSIIIPFFCFLFLLEGKTTTGARCLSAGLYGGRSAEEKRQPRGKWGSLPGLACPGTGLHRTARLPDGEAHQ